jgi:methyl coenzyme M reductase beta subunit
MGGGHPNRFMPYRIETRTSKPLPVPVVVDAECFGCGWQHCREAHSNTAVPCIMQISADTVWHAVAQLIDRFTAGMDVK